MSRRSRFVALVLSLAGFVGLHRFYLGRFWTGLLMLVTLGGCGIWWVVDVYLILTGKLRDGDKQELAWFGGGSQPGTPKSVASTSKPREASEQTQTSEAEPTKPDEETRGTAGMSTISLPGQTKVSTLQ
jgi:TM2 domain-containing membrane protein YozV